MRRAVVWAVMVALAGAVQALGGSFLAGRDVVVALLVESRPEVAGVIAVVLLARLFLFLLAPGWGLYVGVRFALERVGTRATRSSSPPRGGGG